MLAQYIKTALWSSTDESRDDGGDPLDANYGPEDLTDEARATLQAEIDAFSSAIEVWEAETGLSMADSLLRSGDADEYAAHDLWLTQNGHGAGFWDGDWAEPFATWATKWAQARADIYLFVGADGKIHV